MIKDNIISAQKVVQNNQEFLIGVFSIKQIFSFTRFTERIIEHYDDNNIPVYNKYVQRKLENSRVEKIADFLLADPDALFPTNIVLAMPDAAIDTIEANTEGKVTISLNKDVFSEIKKEDGIIYLTIIDGQHRIKGIEKAIERLRMEIGNLRKVISTSNSKDTEQQKENEKKIERKSTQLTNLLNINLLVSFFIDPTLEFQAMIFSTINRTQKTVPASLVSSLFGLSEKDTPQKTALEIVLALNGFDKSPFYNRIKLYGGKYDINQSPPLTQAAMVKSIVDLITTNNREAELDKFKDRKELLVNISPDLPFRLYYAKDNDQFITDILFSFFSAVRKTFTKDGISLWEFDGNTKPRNVLQTTVGYQALLHILVDILSQEKSATRKDKIETYVEYLIKCKSIDFTNQLRYPFTSVSKTVLYLDMSIDIWPATTINDQRVIKLNEILYR